MVEQAVVLVGGRGTRLGEAARTMPKPLMPIDGDRRFLDYLLAHLGAQGFTDIILLAGHLGNQVADRYHGADVAGARIEVIREPEPAGTAGALLYAAERLDPTFLMSNGDSLFVADFLLLEAALAPNDIGALALREVEDPRRYGAVEQIDGRLVEFREKSPLVDGPAWISAGVYLLRRPVVDLVRSRPCSIETQIFPEQCRAGRLGCAPMKGYFIDIGLPDTLALAREQIPLLGLL